MNFLFHEKPEPEAWFSSPFFPFEEAQIRVFVRCKFMLLVEAQKYAQKYSRFFPFQRITGVLRRSKSVPSWEANLCVRKKRKNIIFCVFSFPKSIVRRKIGASMRSTFMLLREAKNDSWNFFSRFWRSTTSPRTKFVPPREIKLCFLWRRKEIAKKNHDFFPFLRSIVLLLKKINLCLHKKQIYASCGSINYFSWEKNMFAIFFLFNLWEPMLKPKSRKK